MKKPLRSALWAAIGMLILILDTKTAIYAGVDGIKLCIVTVVPALFPFFLLSNLLNSGLLGYTGKAFGWLGRILRIPRGSEVLFLVGILGGYPTGAKAVADAYDNNAVSLNCARRMLGFCSNAGPSFLFGIVGSFFTSKVTVFALWLIHIFSAICVGFSLPQCNEETKERIKGVTLNLPQVLKNSIQTMAHVCGWILIFRIVFSYCSRWILWLLPPELQLLLQGALELTLGCTGLDLLGNEAMRFFVASIFLAFGGICVAMQTASITERIGMGMYLPGKALQSLYSAILSVLYLIFTENLTCGLIFSVVSIVILCLFVVCIAFVSAGFKKRGGNFVKAGV